jgi:hypothetical protein
MKKINQSFFVTTVTVGLIILAAQACGQSLMSGPGGIAASPKVRSQLSENARSIVFTPSTDGTYTGYGRSDLAASPKILQEVNGKLKSTIASGPAVVVTSGTRAAENLAASPKVQAQLNDRPAMFEIAPLK